MKTTFLLAMSLLAVSPPPLPAQTEKAFKRHTGLVGAVTFLTDGKFLASGGAGGVVCVWDIDKGECTRELKGHANAVTAIAQSPRNSLGATGSFDHTVRIWVPQGRLECHTLSGHEGPILCLAFTADGKLLSGSIDGTVRLWDIMEGKPLGIVTRHKRW